MTPFPRRKQSSSYGLPRLVPVAGMILFCFLLALVVIQMFQYSRLRGKVETAERLVDEYEFRKAEIAEEVDRLHEPGYIEMLARKWLGLVRSGEVVFQLQD